MQWYYAENGNQLGPVSELELRGKIMAGSVSAEDLVWRDGMDGWKPVASVPELANALVSSAPQETPPAPPVSPYEAPTTNPSTNPGYQGGADVPSYLWQSIVITVMCCPLLGIPAIVYAAKVDGFKRVGDYESARAASASARMWCWVAFGLGLLANVLFLGLITFAEN